jgi:formamidopyrimidine-DNA glycosylase
MTGKFVPDPNEPRPGTRIRLGLSDGSRIAFIDARRFGRIRLAPDAHSAASHPELSRLGPDALELCRRSGGLASVLKGRRRPIKPALMDQSLLAGIGNIYAAEGLFAGRVHPTARCDRVGAARYQAIADGIVASMEATLVRDLGDEINYLQEKGSLNPFTVYGRDGEPCHRCETSIERTVQSGRSTFWCPRCQRR